MHITYKRLNTGYLKDPVLKTTLVLVENLKKRKLKVLQRGTIYYICENYKSFRKYFLWYLKNPTKMCSLQYTQSLHTNTFLTFC